MKKKTQNNNNYKPKKSPNSKNKTDLYQKDSKHVEKKITMMKTRMNYLKRQ